MKHLFPILILVVLAGCRFPFPAPEADRSPEEMTSATISPESVGLPDLNSADRRRAHKALTEAHTSPLHEPVHWQNAATGHEGTIEPFAEGETLTGFFCRKYEIKTVREDEVERATRTYCRKPDGSWQHME